MPYPAALGQRPLEVREAYEALEQYAADYGREPLLLLMHASVPETLRADLLNLIRLNFMPGRGRELSLEADVLFSPLCSALGGGYYRIDAQVRWHGLALLRSRYRDEARPRARRVAELLWRYIESTEQQAARAADPQLSEFLAIQRWVALAFLEPAGAAHAFADALRQGSEAPDAAAVLRLGGLASAIELPLANEPELLAYARGLDALVSGDEAQARSLLGGLGDDEIRVGDIALKSPAELLRQQFPDTVAQAPAERRKTCVLIQGAGAKFDANTGRRADVDRVRAMLRAAVEAAGFDCERAEDLSTERELYARLLSADLVVCAVSVGPDAWYLLGVCMAVRPRGVILVADEDRQHAFELSNQFPKWTVYRSPANEFEQSDRFNAQLSALAEESDNAEFTSVVYLGLPGLLPPVFSDPDEPVNRPPLTPPEGVNRNRCLVIQSFGTKTDPQSGRTFDFDVSYELIKAAVESAGLECVRLDLGAGPGLARMFAMLREAGLVIADLTTNPREVLFELGVRFGLQPARTILVAEKDLQLPQELRQALVLRYDNSSGQLGGAEAQRFRSVLEARIRSVVTKPSVVSPVYAALPQLQPPRMKEQAPAPDATASETYDVFLSFSNADKAWALKLRADLAARGIKVFLDLTSPNDGVGWDQQIRPALLASRHLVCLWSANARSSPWVQRELAMFNASSASTRGATGSMLLVQLDLTPNAYATLQQIAEAPVLAAYAAGIASLNAADWKRVVERIDDAVKHREPPIARRKVFISYCRPYVEYVRLLVDALTDVDVSWDMNLQAGDAWQEGLATMLEAADAVISVAGSETHNRLYPMTEIERSIQLGKRLIPVFVDRFDEPRQLTERMCANVDARGEILYLSALEGEALHSAIAITARNIVKAMAAAPTGAAEQAKSPRSLVIRQHDHSLDFVLLGEHGTPERHAVGSANVASLLHSMIRERSMKEARDLAVTLLPTELAHVLRPWSYRLRLNRAAADLPWELALSFTDLRAPVSVIRQLEGAPPVELFSSRRQVLLVGEAEEVEGIGDMLKSAGLKIALPQGGDSWAVSKRMADDLLLALVFGSYGLPSDVSPAAFARDLAQAGVSCVIATAWPIHQRLVSMFSRLFVDALLRGQRFEAACDEGRKAVFDAEPELSSWAAFQAWGSPDHVLTSGTARSTPILK